MAGLSKTYNKENASGKSEALLIQNLSTLNGAKSTSVFSSPTNCETNLPVMGPNDIPSIACPVATIRLLKSREREMIGNPSGVQGRKPRQISITFASSSPGK